MRAAHNGAQDHTQYHSFLLILTSIVSFLGIFYLVVSTKYLEIELSVSERLESIFKDQKSSWSGYSSCSLLKLAFPAGQLREYSLAIPAYGSFEDRFRRLNSRILNLNDDIGAKVAHWRQDSAILRDYLLVITTIIAGLLIFGFRLIFGSWAKKNKQRVAKALSFIGLAILAFREFYWSLLLAALIMVALGVFQRRLRRKAPNATHVARASSAVQNRAVQTDSEKDESSTLRAPTIEKARNLEFESTLQSGAIDSNSNATDSKDREIFRLQNTITKLKTALKAGEVQLRSVKEELNNARAALNATFSEYSKLRKELQTAKQKLGSDHHNTLYRKDIELFALRKANEQKETQIEELAAKVQEIQRQQKTILESKDAQVKQLVNRLTFMDQQTSAKSEDFDTSDKAVEVRLLKVTNNRRFEPKRENKDAIIAKLREQLAMANKASQAAVTQQAELQRAWDFANDVQNALRKERQRHFQTSEQLQELTVRLAEQETQRGSQTSLSNRLPTIEEDEHNYKELEAMFDTAQKDNLRLHTEVEQLGQQLREAIDKLFSAEQDNHALRNQVRRGTGLNDNIESDPTMGERSARFYRLESQLKEIQNAVTIRDSKIERLENTIVEKNDYIQDLKEEIDAAISFHTQDQDEIENLKQIVAKLEASKEQLLLDHERLALYRTRHSNALADVAALRLSGATFTQEINSQPGADSSEPTQPESPLTMPALIEAASREDVHRTPKNNAKNEQTTNLQPSNVTNAQQTDVTEEKVTRSMSTKFKGMMKRIGKKDVGTAEVDGTMKKNGSGKKSKRDSLNLKSLVIPKDQDVSSRPATASPTHIAIQMVTENATHSSESPSIPQGSRPSTSKNGFSQRVEEKTRPKSYAASETTRPLIGRTWNSAGKSKRNSLYRPMSSSSNIA